MKVCELEGLEVVCLEDELSQWPLLELVLVTEKLDGEVLQAYLFVNCAPELVEHRVEHLWRSALEAPRIAILVF